MLNKKLKCVGLIFGGQSNEHDISIKSAKAIFLALQSESNKKRFKTKTFYIDRQGKWFSSNESILLLEDIKNIKKFKFKNLNNNSNFLKQIDYDDVDVWFPILHGVNGEDGTIQGLLKLTQKPFVGSGVLGSAIGMDKIIMRMIFSQLNIPQVSYLPIQNLDLTNKNTLNMVCEKIIKDLNFPLFVKPANSGSSLGISKVKNKSDIIIALKKAWEIDHRIIVEEGLTVRELECGIIGKTNIKASEVGEVIYKSEWYDFDSKYSTNNEIFIPAKISKETKKTIQDLSIESCIALNINHFARVDFFLEKSSNNILINEINTLPGFTNKSMFPLLWKETGLDIEQLVATLIEYCF